MCSYNLVMTSWHCQKRDSADLETDSYQVSKVSPLCVAYMWKQIIEKSLQKYKLKNADG